MNYEIIGLIATFITLASFLVKGEAKIRLVNAVGCIFFVIYGLCIGAFSVWLLNGVIFFVNLYKGISIIKEDKNA